MPEVIPISSVINQPTTTPVSTGAPDQLGKDAFLKLLVAQLKYQNPLSPTDPGQFMAQTAQFTMVEKLTQLADDISSQRQLGESLAATSLIGKQITWLDNAGLEHSGVATGATYGSAGASVLVGDDEVPLSRISRSQPTPTTNN